MLNFSNIICILSIYWTLSDASPSLISGLVDTVGNLLIPNGVNNAAENLKLCSMEMPSLAEYYGYETDTRSVTTKDGYIVTVFCVYNSTALDFTLNPVIAWHGLMADSHIFCSNYQNQSLAFVLADQGYYVCLPNARGNGFSQGYVNASRNGNIRVNPFYQYSWDQIGEFDVPAVIDAVLDWTEKSKVIYIGHSQGSTAMFVLLSGNPSYNDKVSIFAAVAPVAYFSHTTSPLYKVASQLEFLLKGLYGTQYFPHTYLQGLVEYLVCTLPTDVLCSNLLFLAFGYSSHLDQSRLPLFLCKSPSNFAWGQFLHYVQLVKVDKFQKYDFGSGNVQMYGQSSPPEYDLTQITAKVALFYSKADTLTVDEDVQKLISELSNVVFVQALDASVNFAHFDFVWGRDVAQIVYADLLNVIKYY